TAEGKSTARSAPGLEPSPRRSRTLLLYSKMVSRRRGMAPARSGVSPGLGGIGLGLVLVGPPVLSGLSPGPVVLPAPPAPIVPVQPRPTKAIPMRTLGNFPVRLIPRTSSELNQVRGSAGLAPGYNTPRKRYLAA